jgi:hypothetical protein
LQKTLSIPCKKADRTHRGEIEQAAFHAPENRLTRGRKWFLVWNFRILVDWIRQRHLHVMTSVVFWNHQNYHARRRLSSNLTAHSTQPHENYRQCRKLFFRFRILEQEIVHARPGHSPRIVFEHIFDVCFVFRIRNSIRIWVGNGRMKR